MIRTGLIVLLLLVACAEPRSLETRVAEADSPVAESSDVLGWLYFHDCGEAPQGETKSPAIDCATERFASGDEFRMVFTEKVCGLTDIGTECNDIRSVLLGNDRGDLFVVPLAYVASEPSMRVYRKAYTLSPTAFPVNPPLPTFQDPVSMTAPSSGASRVDFKTELSISSDGQVTLCNVRSAEVPEEVRRAVCAALQATTYQPATALSIPIASSAWVACQWGADSASCRSVEVDPGLAWASGANH